MTEHDRQHLSADPSIRRRFVAGFVGATSLVLGVLFVLVYQIAVQRHLMEVRTRLHDTALAISIGIDGDAHDRIHVATDPDYKVIADKLRVQRAQMTDIGDVYTMRLRSTGTWEFVVDAEPEDGSIYSPPGTPYDIDHDAAAAAAVIGPTSSERVYHDEYGDWISGYAPIRASDGHVVGIVGVDMSDTAFIASSRRMIAWMVGALGCASVLALFVSLSLAPLLADPIETERKLRRAAQLTAESQRDQAVEAARLRAEFLSVMSHELRTPMSGVIGLTELTLDRTTDPVVLSNLRTVLESARTLTRILNDVLDFSKFEATGVDLEPTDFSPVDLLRQTTDLLGPSVRAKGLALRVSVDPDVPDRFRADAGRLGQVLLNLINNALKFTETGAITVRLGLVDGQIRFEVEDTGAGIPPEIVDRLFEPFVSAPGGHARRHGGTGLGLSIAHRIITRMGGTIGFTPAPAGGTVFWFQVAAAEARPGSDIRLVSPRRAHLPLHDVHVLVVEDNVVNRMVVTAHLAALGITFDTAASGEEALGLVELGGYDLILMDCQMPEMDGMETTRRIRTLSADLLRTPIVALTAHVGPVARRQCLDAGMNEVVCKPFTRAELVDALIGSLHVANAARASTPAASSGDGDSLAVLCVAARPALVGGRGGASCFAAVAAQGSAGVS